jgi:hypothetical protein
MVHCTSTVATETDGGLFTAVQVLGARDWYCGSIVSGPEIPVPLWPAPSALLHPNGVSSVRTKKQKAIELNRVWFFMVDTPQKQCETAEKIGVQKLLNDAIVAGSIREKTARGGCRRALR